MKALIFIFSLLLLSSTSFALVDLKNANYAEAWVDINLPGTGYDLKVERGYNSRTLFNGMFGFGWCSDFETKLELTAEGNVLLTECGAGVETLFTPQSFSKKDVDKVISQIIAKEKETNKTAPAKYFAGLDEELRSKDYLRNEMTKKHGIKASPVSEGLKYMANGRETDSIERKGEFYVRNLPDNTVQKFTLGGKLSKLFDRNGNSIELNYEADRLKMITDSSGRKFIFSYFDNGKVKQIVGPNNLKSEYKFKDLNNLVWAKTSSGNIYEYEYDDLHNMVKVNYPDKTFKAMTYNKDEDWVTSFKDRDGCKEDYVYENSSDDPKNHFWSTVQKKCDGKVISKARYEFWYKKKVDNSGVYLSRHVTSEGDQSSDISYNESGRPLTITRGKKVTKFEYYPNGLLSKRTTPDGQTTKMFYENTFKKVSKVERAGKSTDFQYDLKGNLVKAINSDGMRVTLSYDNRGRIVALEDQAKRRVNIKYEEKFGKPTVIERTGVGSINVVYDGKGEISKVSSAAGTTVAIQVAGAFNNLLELLQPAGISLSL